MHQEGHLQCQCMPQVFFQCTEIKAHLQMLTTEDNELNPNSTLNDTSKSSSQSDKYEIKKNIKEVIQNNVNI